MHTHPPTDQATTARSNFKVEYLPRCGIQDGDKPWGALLCGSHHGGAITNKIGLVENASADGFSDQFRRALAAERYVQHQIHRPVAQLVEGSLHLWSGPAGTIQALYRVQGSGMLTALHSRHEERAKEVSLLVLREVQLLHYLCKLRDTPGVKVLKHCLTLLLPEVPLVPGAPDATGVHGRPPLDLAHDLHALRAPEAHPPRTPQKLGG
mmetsp:Transcript_5316/g.16459  ORF Transcript_5316/g.16459 Transcript_5316/m.16459 type:complete len:209 (+) Transcript_5316:20-646(+)